MEGKYGSRKSDFVAKWTPIRDMVKKNFQSTFLVNTRNYYMLADYVDAAGQHTECRPNQLAAAYIPYPLLDEEVQGDIVKAVSYELMTRRGIRTLSPRSADYRSVYDGSQIQRDTAAVNGCAQTMVLAIAVDLCFRLNGASYLPRAKWCIEGFFEDAGMHGIGMFSEFYDADPPHEPHGAIASATATASLMRCEYLIEKYSKIDKEEKK